MSYPEPPILAPLEVVIALTISLAGSIKCLVCLFQASARLSAYHV